MERSNFNTEDSYKLYQAYISQLRKKLNPLIPEDRIDIIREIDSHIYEALTQRNDGLSNEKEILENILKNLGSPDSLIKTLIAEKKLTSATQKYNIIEILKAIFLIFKTGGQYILVCVGYLLVLGFGIVLIAKILYPDKTGLFVENGDIVGIGYFNRVNESAVDLLGYWIIPIMILLIVIFYYLVTFLLRKAILFRSKKTKKAYLYD